MALVNELLPIVVDPSHKRFGQIGKMITSDPDYGCYVIGFDDGEKEVLNDGHLTGIPQFMAATKEYEAGVRRLQAELPAMKADILRITGEIVKPLHRVANKPKNDEVIAKFKDFINGVIFGVSEVHAK